MASNERKIMLKSAKEDYRLTIIGLMILCITAADVLVMILLLPAIGFAFNGIPIIVFFIVFMVFLACIFGIWLCILGEKKRVNYFRKLAYPEQY